MISCKTAPVSGGSHPATANNIPIPLKIMPPIAVCRSNRARTAGDVYQFVYFAQGRIHYHRVRSLGCHVAALPAQGHAGCGRKHGGRVVDAIAYKERFVLSALRTDEFQLFFGSGSGIELFDTDNLGKMFNFHLPVSRKKDDLACTMPGLEMPDKRAALRARSIMET